MPETFPLTPDYIDEFDLEPEVEIIQYRSGEEQRIQLAEAKEGMKLSWNHMSSEDKETLRTFYKARGATAEAFIFHDHHTGEDVLVRFDSALKIRTTKVNDYDVAVDIIKVSE